MKSNTKIEDLSKNILKNVYPSIVFYLKELKKQEIKIFINDEQGRYPSFRIDYAGNFFKLNLEMCQESFNVRQNWLHLGNVFDINECFIFTDRALRENTYISYAKRIIKYCEDLKNEFEEI